MRRGEIWLINLDPTIGAEIRKTRPVVIVNDDAVGVLPLRVIVPITDWKQRYQNVPWMVRLTPDDDNGLSKTSAADAFQVRSVSQQRFIKQVGVITQSQIEELTVALGTVLAIPL